MYDLPHSLIVNGVEHPIRTDYRDVLKVIQAMDDPDLESNDRVFVCLYIMYEDFEDMSADDYENALKEVMKFISCGKENTSKAQDKKLVDFEQDEYMIMAAVNRVAGKEVREESYMHWWTFMGYYMEIGGECVYSQVLNIRSKKAKGKKLEKYEEEFYAENKEICDLKEKLSKEEIEEKEALLKIL